MPFYEKGDVRIHYQEAGSGFPMLIIPGGGLNSTPAFFTGSSPFNPMVEFKGEFRYITMDCAMRPTASLPARWRSTGPGMPTPMIRSG